MKAAVYFLLVIIATLLSLGLVTLASVSDMGMVTKQLVWICIALIAGFTMAQLDYRLLKKLSWAIALLTIVMLVGVLFMPEVNGARRWFPITSTIKFQPSELVKLLVIILLAGWLSHIKRMTGRFWDGFILPLIGLALVSGLLLLEPDFGTTLLLMGVGILLLFMGGTNVKYLVFTGVSGLILFSFLVMNDPTRMDRIIAWQDTEMHQADESYQMVQSMHAFHSGGLWGQGYGNSMQKNGFVPEDHTDFILAIMAEEFGLLASFGVTLLFLGLFLCGLTISQCCHNRFGKLLALGITLCLSLQAAVNIGVVSGLFPTSGMTLPFISYGGSHIMVTGLMIGVLISVARHADEAPEFEEVLARNASWA